MYKFNLIVSMLLLNAEFLKCSFNKMTTQCIVFLICAHKCFKSVHVPLLCLYGEVTYSMLTHI